jgi:PIN domain nuclease of toxin-antitoxin system
MEAVAALPMLHRDPFDRFIVAPAITEPLGLVTHDHHLAAYSDTVISW